jgi:proteasome lid subunit RPN8/RPN11
VLASEHHIIISRRRWQAVLEELARRGRGTRESGAFLLARIERSPRRVADVVYFDDLDPDSLDGSVSIRGEAFGRLWEHCEQRGLRVIADVHTHPGQCVEQSHIDAANPMVARRGHVGIIVPHFAQRSPKPRAVGFHVYQGDRTWTSAFGPKAALLLRRTWW